MLKILRTLKIYVIVDIAIIMTMIGLLIFSVFFSSGANAGHAQSSLKCLPREQLVKALNEKFNERRQVFGLISDKKMFEIFVSPKGTWTVLITGLDKISCIGAAGNSYEQWKAKRGRPL